MMTEVKNKKDISSNKSRTYLIPILASKIDMEFEYLMIDTYIKFNPQLELDYPIGILFENESSDAFNEYKIYLEQCYLFWRSYTLEDKCLYVFQFPEEYIMDYLNFKEGKYSELSADVKKVILKYTSEVYKYPPLVEDVVGVLWKHKTRRSKLEKELGMSLPVGAELASRINYDEETFNFSL
jgi:hypothetical protein